MLHIYMVSPRRGNGFSSVHRAAFPSCSSSTPGRLLLSVVMGDGMRNADVPVADKDAKVLVVPLVPK
jgi:hypothetical protein